MSSKSFTTTHWHQHTADKKPLKKSHKSNFPDVYPQELRQEEDTLTADRISRGYITRHTPHEHDSFIFNTKTKMDGGRLEETLLKCGSFCQAVIVKKNEDNAKMSKKVIKEQTLSNYTTLLTNKKFGSTASYANWFEDLSKNRSSNSLVKKWPVFQDKDECFEYLYMFKMSPMKAIWYLKVASIFDVFAFKNSFPPKKSTFDNLALDYTHNRIVKYMRYTFLEMSRLEEVEGSPVYKKWPYFAMLFKHAFEDGIVDRYEFLLEICDLLGELIEFPLHKPTVFKILLLYGASFGPFIFQNTVICRRIAFVICQRIKRYHQDFNDKMKRTMEGARVFTVQESLSELMACKDNGEVLEVMFAFLAGIIIDCPLAVIRNANKIECHIPLTRNGYRVENFKESKKIFVHLSESPFCELPCEIDKLICYDLFKSPFIQEKLCEGLANINERSKGIETRWKSSFDFGTEQQEISNAITEMIELLDNIFIINDHKMKESTNKLFNPTTKPKFENEKAIKMRFLLKWATTAQRNSIHRGMVAAKFMKVILENVQDTNEVVMNTFIDFLDTEGPKVGDINYDVEFGNVVYLFMELQNIGLLNFHAYMWSLIKNGKYDMDTAVIDKYEFAKATNLPSKIAWNNTTKVTTHNNFQLRSEISEAREALNMPELSTFDRILYQLPIPQGKGQKSANLLHYHLIYGHAINKMEAIKHASNTANSILAIWKQQMWFIFDVTKLRFTLHNQKLLATNNKNILHQFKSSSYRDQVIIAHEVSADLLEEVYNFKTKNADKFPTSEAFDIVIKMFEISKDLNGFIVWADNILKYLIEADQLITFFNYNVRTGAIVHPCVYSIVGALSEHFQYFLMHPKAPDICGHVYNFIQKEVNIEKYGMNGSTPPIVMFLHACKVYLSTYGIYKQNGAPPLDQHLARAYPPIYSPNLHEKIEPTQISHNETFLMRDIRESSRAQRSNSFRIQIKQLTVPRDNNRYSFMLNCYQAAICCGKDTERLINLTNYVAAVSHNANFHEEWLEFFLDICCGGILKPPAANYMETILAIEAKDRFAISTFIALLVGKYVVSPKNFIQKLMESTFLNCYKKDEHAISSAKMSICIAIETVAKIFTADLEPIRVDKFEHKKPKHLPTLSLGIGKHRSREVISEVKVEPAKTSLVSSTKKPSYVRVGEMKSLAILHLRELDTVLINLLKLLNVIYEKLQKAFKVPAIEFLAEYLKTAVYAICEKTWVVEKVYLMLNLIPVTDFNRVVLGKKSYVMEQTNFFRLTLRRKIERQLKVDLTTAFTSASHKKYVDLSLANLTIWNLRATSYDLQGMLDNMLSDSKTSETSVKMQNSEQLKSIIGRSVHDMFLVKENRFCVIPPFETGDHFRIVNLTNKWLVSRLLALIEATKPADKNGSTINSKFLAEVQKIFDATVETNRDRFVMATWLLSQYSFHNLVTNCLVRETNAEHGIVEKLFKYFLDLINKSKTRSISRLKDDVEREGLILRISLVGGMFDKICNVKCIEKWCVTLYQLLFFEIVSPERDPKLFEITFDILYSVLHNTLISGVNNIEDEPIDTKRMTDLMANNNYYKKRFHNYFVTVKKIRKEAQDKYISSSARILLQLLPLNKKIYEYMMTEPYGGKQLPPIPVNRRNGNRTNAHARDAANSRLYLRGGYKVCDKLKLTSFDIIHAAHFELSLKKNMNFNCFQVFSFDKKPEPIQRSIVRLLYHKHYLEFPRMSIVGIERDPKEDILLCQPQIELIDVPEEDIINDVQSIPIKPPPRVPNVPTTIPDPMARIENGPASVKDDESVLSTLLLSVESKSSPIAPISAPMSIPKILSIEDISGSVPPVLANQTIPNSLKRPFPPALSTSQPPNIPPLISSIENKMDPYSASNPMVKPTLVPEVPNIPANSAQQPISTSSTAITSQQKPIFNQPPRPDIEMMPVQPILPIPPTQGLHRPHHLPPITMPNQITSGTNPLAPKPLPNINQPPHYNQSQSQTNLQSMLNNPQTSGQKLSQMNGPYLNQQPSAKSNSTTSNQGSQNMPNIVTQNNISQVNQSPMVSQPPPITIPTPTKQNRKRAQNPNGPPQPKPPKKKKEPKGSANNDITIIEQNNGIPNGMSSQVGNPSGMRQSDISANPNNSSINSQPMNSQPPMMNSGPPQNIHNQPLNSNVNRPSNNLAMPNQNANIGPGNMSHSMSQPSIANQQGIPNIRNPHMNGPGMQNSNQQPNIHGQNINNTQGHMLNHPHNAQQMDMMQINRPSLGINSHDNQSMGHSGINAPNNQPPLLSHHNPANQPKPPIPQNPPNLLNHPNSNQSAQQHITNPGMNQNSQLSNNPPTLSIQHPNPNMSNQQSHSHQHLNSQPNLHSGQMHHKQPPNSMHESANQLHGSNGQVLQSNLSSIHPPNQSQGNMIGSQSSMQGGQPPTHPNPIHPNNPSQSNQGSSQGNHNPAQPNQNSSQANQNPMQGNQGGPMQNAMVNMGNQNVGVAGPMANPQNQGQMGGNQNVSNQGSIQGMGNQQGCMQNFGTSIGSINNQPPMQNANNQPMQNVNNQGSMQNVNNQVPMQNSSNQGSMHNAGQGMGPLIHPSLNQQSMHPNLGQQAQMNNPNINSSQAMHGSGAQMSGHQMHAIQGPGGMNQGIMNNPGQPPNQPSHLNPHQMNGGQQMNPGHGMNAGSMSQNMNSGLNQNMNLGINHNSLNAPINQQSHLTPNPNLNQQMPSMNSGMNPQQSHVPLNSSMNAQLSSQHNLNSGMNQSGHPGMTQHPSQNNLSSAGMNAGLGQGSNQSMNSGMSQGMSNVMNQGIHPGMTQQLPPHQNINSGMNQPPPHPNLSGAINQSSHQSLTPAMNSNMSQPGSQPIHQPNSQTMHQPNSQSIHQSNTQTMHQPGSQPNAPQMHPSQSMQQPNHSMNSQNNILSRHIPPNNGNAMNIGMNNPNSMGNPNAINNNQMNNNLMNNSSMNGNPMNIPPMNNAMNNGPMNAMHSSSMNQGPMNGGASSGMNAGPNNPMNSMGGNVGMNINPLHSNNQLPQQQQHHLPNQQGQGAPPMSHQQIKSMQQHQLGNQHGQQGGMSGGYSQQQPNSLMNPGQGGGNNMMNQGPGMVGNMQQNANAPYYGQNQSSQQMPPNIPPQNMPHQMGQQGGQIPPPHLQHQMPPHQNVGANQMGQPNANMIRQQQMHQQQQMTHQSQGNQMGQQQLHNQQQIGPQHNVHQQQIAPQHPNAQNNWSSNVHGQQMNSMPNGQQLQQQRNNVGISTKDKLNSIIKNKQHANINNQQINPMAGQPQNGYDMHGPPKHNHMANPYEGNVQQNQHQQRTDMMMNSQQQQQSSHSQMQHQQQLQMAQQLPNTQQQHNPTQQGMGMQGQGMQHPHNQQQHPQYNQHNYQSKPF
uniref:Med12 domain-containing protein n=1 Tax=Rhabditophanes sp. KR3021 TaxID=114890 RepID=A0AC35TYY8_9BILA